MSEGRTVRSVCVFCGSRPGAAPAFARAAAALGTAIARRGMSLVYGGAKVGLMGVLADAALGAGGRVVGVMPKGLISKEIAHDGLSELFVTATMHDRKDRMIALSDAFISMPGGWGTYDELFEVLTLAQIGFHDKPSAFLNVERYFDPLVALLRHTITNEFAAPEHAGLYVVEEEADPLLDAIVAWRPPPLGDKRTDRRGVVSTEEPPR
jgi:uncharacterized protein (TIGR00730 family)